MFSIIAIIFCISTTVVGEGVCYKDQICLDMDSSNNYRYLFYDVNPSEGFNLRRDVFMRMAVLVNKLKQSEDPNLKSIMLVLPPWSHLVHWGYSEVPEQIPWSTFFDIKSLQKFAPVIELHEYFSQLKQKKYTKCNIDKVYILQHYEYMFESGKFEEKWSIEKCQKPPKLRVFYYSNFTTNNVQCLSFHGPATKLSEILEEDQSRTILFEHAEVALHDNYGSSLYWKARRSMRFNVELREIARMFRKSYLDSNDEDDHTFLADDWRNDKPKRSAKGGPYLGVHLRRRDFLRSRTDQLPTLQKVADQITRKLEELKLTKVFIATDAPKKEYDDLKSKLPKYEVYRYTAPKDVEQEYSAGGIAIIDQIICSYARYFIGTAESTFTFRIQEEREILGFPSKTTFNVLCKDKNTCSKSSVWKIAF